MGVGRVCVPVLRAQCVDFSDDDLRRKWHFRAIELDAFAVHLCVVIDNVDNASALRSELPKHFCNGRSPNCRKASGYYELRFFWT